MKCIESVSLDLTSKFIEFCFEIGIKSGKGKIRKRIRHVDISAPFMS